MNCKRMAPLALLIADMPFGSYQASLSQGIRNVVRMIKRTGCDAVKLEVSNGSANLVQALADAGVATSMDAGRFLPPRFR